MIRALEVNTCMGVNRPSPDGPKGFCLDMKLTCSALQFTCTWHAYSALMHPPVLDMFAGVGYPILPADHMVNRPKLTATHLALNFTISPGISSRIFWNPSILLHIIRNPSPKEPVAVACSDLYSQGWKAGTRSRCPWKSGWLACSEGSPSLLFQAMRWSTLKYWSFKE